MSCCRPPTPAYNDPSIQNASNNSYFAPSHRIKARNASFGAVGCIFGEMLNNSPLFPGENDIDQLCCVLRVLGTPNEKSWPGMGELPDYKKISFPETPPIPFETLLPDASTKALDLLKRSLLYPSSQRIPAKEALVHLYFFMEPLPAHHSELPIPQRGAGKRIRRAHHPHDYSIDTPLEESLIDPDLIAPHVQLIS